MSWRALPAFLVALVLASGCVGTGRHGVADYYEGKHAEAEEKWRERAGSRPNSRTLYLLRLGSLELERGRLEEARRHFVEATRAMESLEAAGEFEALVGEEAAKEFKGDPWERLMAHWYLGLIDYMAGDLRMALPDFKSAALADGGSKYGYQADAASVFLMLGRTYLVLGKPEKARREFEAARGVHTFRQVVELLSDEIYAAAGRLGLAGPSGSLSQERQRSIEAARTLMLWGASAGASAVRRPAEALSLARERALDELERAARGSEGRERVLLGRPEDEVEEYLREIADSVALRVARVPAPGGRSPIERTVEAFADPSNNLLIFVGAGRGPYKYRAGAYGRLARVGKGRPEASGAAVFVDGHSLGPTQKIEDVYYQAATRGGRPMDAILAGKAALKAVIHEAASDEWDEVFDSDSNSEEREQAFFNALVYGLLGALVRAEADVRSWETLPDEIHAFAAGVEPGRRDVLLRFAGGGAGDSAGAGRLLFRGVEVPEDGEAVLYARAGRGGVWSALSREEVAGAVAVWRTAGSSAAEESSGPGAVSRTETNTDGGEK